MNQVTLLRDALRPHLSWHGARLSFIAAFLIALLRVKTVNFNELATALILNPTQVAVLKTKSLKLPKVLTVTWALAEVARLGGYLEHRRSSPIGIQVLWRGWSKLHDLCEGWQLASLT